MKKSFFLAEKISFRRSPHIYLRSFIVSVIFWLLLSTLTFYVIQNFKDRARLLRDNENERIYNLLFTSLRNYDDFGSAIEDNPALSERIAGFAVYGRNLAPLYSWGETPAAFDEAMLEEKYYQSRSGRFTIPDKKTNSVKFVISVQGPQAPQITPPSPPQGRRRNQMMSSRNERMQTRIIERQGFPFFNILARGGYYYTNILHRDYWRTIAFGNILFPVCCLALLGIVFSVRHLYLRNREYRERIEDQENLVILGTAAGTLAHEIKTPLSSIRLQTGILEKIHAEGREELSIINEEVDRLSSLSRRINDYIREGRGNPQALNLYDLVLETGTRLCGRTVMTEDSNRGAWVFADSERLRSIFENLLRNALESGGNALEVESSVQKSGGSIIVRVRDRGNGIPEEDLVRIFDPFFTKKSGGTGIGLSISKRFAEASGASIVIKNRGTQERGAEAIVIFQEYSAEKGGIA